MKSVRKELLRNNSMLILSICIFMILNSIVYLFSQYKNDELLKSYQQLNDLVLVNNNRKIAFKLYCKSLEPELLLEYEDNRQTLNEKLAILAPNIQFDNDSNMYYRIVSQVVEHSHQISKNYIEGIGTNSSENINYIDEVDLEIERYMNQLINYYLKYLNMEFKEQSTFLKRLFNFMNTTMLFSFLFLLIQNYRISDKILSSIKKLSIAASNITNKNFESSDIEEHNFLELNQVSGTFDNMKHTIRDMIIELKEKHQMKELLQEAKIKVLQMQMNPHFLFNTLSLVVRNIQLDEKETSIQLIHSISRILRSSIEVNSLAIPLDEEINLLEAYIYIEKLHLKGRVTFNLDVRKSFSNEEFLIPPLTIQPLVENSIKHGLKDMIKDGQVEILITEKPEYMEIIVSDNGVGFQTNQTNNQSEHGIPKSSIGLNNVKERLALYYKNDDVIKIERIDNMTKITLKLYRTKRSD